MLLVADSGSTKCDWLFLDGLERSSFETVGLNPLLMSLDEMSAVLEASEMGAIAQQVRALFFYGTACSSPERQAFLKSILENYFPEAKVSVDHDMMAAARATCGQGAGIVCILGTGSNAAFYDGEQLYPARASLGYLLGDQGSGMHIGKTLLHDYFYGRMPKETALLFEERYDLKREKVLQHLYKEARPNAYLASFAKFVTANEQEYTVDLVKSCLCEFVETHILAIPDYKSLPVHFVGSIAYNFDYLLAELSPEYGFKMGMPIQKPIFNLGEYHSKQSAS